jgi:DNA-binding beta-propeller fold protein YncE
MKKCLTILLVLIHFACQAQQKPQVAFTIPEKDIIPEGIAYDAAEKSFYLSSINKRKILKIAATGKISDFVKSGQDDILEVLGMKVDDTGKLWACNNTPETDNIKVANVHVYDTRTGKLFRKYRLADGTKHLFNDLCFTATGDTYLTDSDAGAVYVIRKGADKPEAFLPPGSLRYPNGIATSADEKKIYVSTGSGLGIVAIDRMTKEIKPVSHARFLVIALDGLYRYGNKLIGVQNSFFPEAVLQFDLSADGASMDRISFLASNDPAFDVPTTGVVAGDEFYFIANSQLFQLIGNKGNIKDPGKLNATLIMKIKLN